MYFEYAADEGEDAALNALAYLFMNGLIDPTTGRYLIQKNIS